ncbi:MAG: ACT domain-containing protein [Spirochaetaceae bacterium]|nr:ACT domain-containing protein [Spirochaetaceae bacterium]
MSHVSGGRLLVVTVVGHDRPGIIAEATGLLAELGANLEDSSMTILRGHFAMVLVASAEVTAEEAQRALDTLSDDTLSISVREVPHESVQAPVGPSYLLSVHGADRPGIVSTVTARISAVGGNVTDLTTRLADDLYVLVAEVDIPVAADIGALREGLADVARDLGVEVSLRAVATDDL